MVTRTKLPRYLMGSSITFLLSFSFIGEIICLSSLSVTVRHLLVMRRPNQPRLTAINVVLDSTGEENIPDSSDINKKGFLESDDKAIATNSIVTTVAVANLGTDLVVTGHDELMAQKEELNFCLFQLNDLKELIESTSDPQEFERIRIELRKLESTINELTARLIPPEGLSRQDYIQGIVTFAKLPLGERLILCQALASLKQQEANANNKETSSGFTAFKAATSFEMIPDIVTMLYVERNRLTQSVMQEAVQIVKSESRNIVRGPRQFNSNGGVEKELSLNDNNRGLNRASTSNNVRSLFSNAAVDNRSMEEIREEGTIQQLLPRVTRVDNRVATEDDLRTVLSIIDDTDNKFFIRTGKPEIISGGYVIRGKCLSSKMTSTDLIKLLDSKLSSKKEFTAQLFYIPDITTRGLEDSLSDSGNPDPILVLLKKDMSPTTNRWFKIVTSISAIVTSLIFTISIFGGNDVMTAKITEGPSIGDYAGIEFFNEKVFEVLIPIILIQIIRESGHWLIAKRDNLKITVPMLIPFWQSLPFMGSQTQLKESPQNLKSLFDFALIGPFVGILSSLAFLILGLIATVSASPETNQFFPAVPVSTIKLSTLGGSMIDNFLGGAGFVTLQDPKSAIPLHPFAIAGFTSLIMNSIDLLPLGANNGGRLSLSLFGRKGHSVIGGATWCALLVFSLFGESTDVLVTAWIIYNLIQNDQEVPCRDEVENVDAMRSLSAFGIWFFALLVLVPIS